MQSSISPEPKRRGSSSLECVAYFSGTAERGDQFVRGAEVTLLECRGNHGIHRVQLFALDPYVRRRAQFERLQLQTDQLRDPKPGRKEQMQHGTVVANIAYRA